SPPRLFKGFTSVIISSFFKPQRLSSDPLFNSVTTGAFELFSLETIFIFLMGTIRTTKPIDPFFQFSQHLLICYNFSIKIKKGKNL
ncbi:hypothetical protein HMPREF1430_00461, partial [Helicobacter pylori GAM96Ai]